MLYSCLRLSSFSFPLGEGSLVLHFFFFLSQAGKSALGYTVLSKGIP